MLSAVNSHFPLFEQLHRPSESILFSNSCAFKCSLLPPTHPPLFFLFDVAFQDKYGLFPAIARFPSERRRGCVRSTSTDNQPILPGLRGEGEADPHALSVCIWPLGVTTCPPRLSAPYWLHSSPCKKDALCFTGSFLKGTQPECCREWLWSLQSPPLAKAAAWSLPSEPLFTYLKLGVPVATSGTGEIQLMKR